MKKIIKFLRVKVGRLYFIGIICFEVCINFNVAFHGKLHSVLVKFQLMLSKKLRTNVLFDISPAYPICKGAVVLT